MEVRVICNNVSSYESPIMLVKEKNGSWRLCIDYRATNQVTIKDKCPIHLIKGLLDELSGVAIFSKIDLCYGCW